MAALRYVLIVNPASGRGRTQHLDLVGQCRARGIETVIRQAGEDISELARTAVARGAEILGVAGGDGSQAAGAAVAAEYDVPYVCVPAGTRNHFALDVGVNPKDVIGALEAFLGGTERRIDLAKVNNRVFVNNASMGLYGWMVQSREYRDAKLRTVIGKLPDLVGPAAQRFDLRFTGPDGREHADAALLLVSNNPYLFDPRPGHGTRGTMNGGILGVVSVTNGPPWQGVQEWAPPDFRVESDKAVEVGLDGEAVVMDPPLVFEPLPSALRIRVPRW
ncbi:MAG TPA: diacylglycerol kinase family protein [Acidimicrobiales bacterium]|nr:diacylglycerol kinase family protein [Acidimicrobiales bacterium]